MTKHIRDGRCCIVAKEDEGVEVVIRQGNRNQSTANHLFTTFTLDPEAMAASGDADHSDDTISSTNDVIRRDVKRRKWIAVAVTLLLVLATTVVVDVLIKQEHADNDSTSVSVRKLHNLFDDTRVNLFENNPAAIEKRVRINNDKALADCCVNIATGTCHTTFKCNTKEKECIKCNKKTNKKYVWQTVSVGDMPAEPCCVNMALNTCHENRKCNQKEKNCQNGKCQQEGYSTWKVRSTQTPAPTLATPAPTNSPTLNPVTLAPTGNPTSTAAPTSSPTNATPSPTGNPTRTTQAPTNSPITTPATQAPTGTPTSSTPATPAPTDSPTLKPMTLAPTGNPTSSTPAPTEFLDLTVYEYTDTGNSCSIGGGNNFQGPAPLTGKENVVVDFWAFGDSPYDFMVKTCLDDDGKASTCKKCAMKNSDINKMPYPNTCTFEGEEYDCVKDSIIPFMNQRMNGGDGAFQVHLGDILKGTNKAANSRRCTEASFSSRAKLFQPAKNFLLINGDNESNECKGYDIEKPSDPIRSMWRDKFGKYSFTSAFPAITGGGKPSISRLEGNEEIFGFEYKSIAFFGLDNPSGQTYITDHAPEDLNAKFVRDTLAADASCDLKSIVMFSHRAPRTPVDDEIEAYFDRCGVLPTLVVLGNAHPSTYCLTKEDERITLTVEAFSSGPLLVTVVRDGKEGGSDYFHVADSQLKNTNSVCPEFASVA